MAIYPLRSFFSPEEPSGLPVYNGYIPLPGQNRCGDCPVMPPYWQIDVLDGGWPSFPTSDFRPFAGQETALLVRSVNELWFNLGINASGFFAERYTSYFRPEFGAPWSLSFDDWVSSAWSLQMVGQIIGGDGGAVFYGVFYKSAADISNGRFRCKESNIFMPWNIQLGETVTGITVADGWPRIQITPVYP